MGLLSKIFRLSPKKRPQDRFRIIQLSNGKYKVQELKENYYTHEWEYKTAFTRAKIGPNSWGCITDPMVYDTLKQAEKGLADLKEMYACIEEETGKVIGTSN